jgi:hypothetical protein
MTTNTVFDKKQQHALEVQQQISQILETLRFGSIKIIVHENKVVQIERREKLRINNS